MLTIFDRQEVVDMKIKYAHILEDKYKFDSLIDAAKFLATENQNPRRIQNCIWQVLQKRYGKKSYRGCTWEYADDKIVNGPPKKDVLVE